MKFPIGAALLSLLTSAVVAQQSPIIVGGDGCEDLLSGDGAVIVVGEVCATIVGESLEIRIIATDGCVLIETHICNLPVNVWTSDDGQTAFQYSINIEEVYDFTCGVGDEGTFDVAGHATLVCGDSDPISAYYSLWLECPPDETTTTVPPTTTTTGMMIGNPECPEDIDCTETVGEGSYVQEDCDCSPINKPCAACPMGTRCQPADEANGIPLLCIDCMCGFCDMTGMSCCTANANANNCVDNSNAMECNLQEDYFPSYPLMGNSCGGVEVTNDPKNGCGCKPQATTACSYSQSAVTEPCYVCSNSDIFEGVCPLCLPCIVAGCPAETGVCVEGAADAPALAACLAPAANDDCRAACDVECSNII